MLSEVISLSKSLSSSLEALEWEFPGTICNPLSYAWDNFESFHLWRDFTSLARALHLFVFDRGGHSEGEFRTLLEGFGIASLRARFIPFAHAISSTRIRERLSRGDFSEIPPFLLPTLKKFLQKPCYNGAQNLS